MTDEEKAKLLADTLEAWGECDLVTRYSHADVWERISDMFDAPMRAQRGTDCATRPLRRISFYQVLDRFNPAPAEKDSRLLAIFKSKEHKDADRRTIGKPHKMIKYVLPYLTDEECGAFAQWWRDKIQTQESALVVKTGDTREDFARVYKAPCISGNPTFCNGRKSLSGSCMRYGFDTLPAHPAEAYASGDFQIAYVENPDGQIGARVIIRPSNKTHAPVYLSTTLAGEKLESWLTENGYEATERGFYGAQLLWIETRNGGIVAPYLDICSDAEIDTDGKTITLTRHGGFSFRSTAGEYMPPDNYDSLCDCCGEGMMSEDSIYVESREEDICQSCYERDYFTCAGNGNVYHENCACDVWEMRGNREVTTSQRYSDEYLSSVDSDGIVYCDTRREYWLYEDVVFSDSMSDYFPTGDIGKLIFQSDLDSEYYDISEKIDLPNGQSWTLDQVKESGHYTLTQERDGPEKTRLEDDEFVDCSKYVWIARLNDGLDYDESGDVVDNQLKLDLVA